MTTVKQLRSIQSEIRRANDELRAINDGLKTHPQRFIPLGNGRPEDQKAMRRWQNIKTAAEAEKAPLIQKMAYLNDTRDRVLGYLNDQPIPMTTLGGVLDALVAIESRLAADPAGASDALIRYIDQLEQDEDRARQAGRH